MTTSPMRDVALDAAAAHLHFSKTCFNEAWSLIEKPDRTAADDEAMVLINQASLWHWSQRPDCTDRQWAVGYWQASRIRALLGHADEAMRYGRLTVDRSATLTAFYQAYAYEALARAARVAGDTTASRVHANRARELVDAVDDTEERELIEADLATPD